MRPIDIVPSGGPEARLWIVTREVAELLNGIPWVLIGGQMVAIIEREHGADVSRTTIDIDALVDVRAVAQATREATARLQKRGFSPNPTPEGEAYRFTRGDDIVDLLAPDHLGPKADLTTTTPGKTLEMPGGTQALKRARTVIVGVGSESFGLPVPSLLGAIIIKARATAVAKEHEKHRRDLACLLALVPDIEAIAVEMTKKERGYLRARSELLDARHVAWRGVANAEDGVIALERLSTG